MTKPVKLNKGDFVRLLSVRLNKTVDETTEMVDAFWDVLQDEVELGHMVRFQGRGRFEMKDRKGHKGRNPKSKEEYEIPAHKSFVFTASRTYKRRLRSDNEKTK